MCMLLLVNDVTVVPQHQYMYKATNIVTHILVYHLHFVSFTAKPNRLCH